MSAKPAEKQRSPMPRYRESGKEITDELRRLLEFTRQVSGGRPLPITVEEAIRQGRDDDETRLH